MENLDSNAVNELERETFEFMEFEKLVEIAVEELE